MQLLLILLLSVGEMVARVVSKYMIKFDVIDLICRLCSETFLDDSVFLLRHLHLEVVEDRSETSEVNKTCSCAVFVLEVWLNQEPSVFHISSKSL